MTLDGPDAENVVVFFFKHIKFVEILVDSTAGRVMQPESCLSCCCLCFYDRPMRVRYAVGIGLVFAVCSCGVGIVDSGTCLLYVNESDTRLNTAKKKHISTSLRCSTPTLIGKRFLLLMRTLYA